MTVTVVPRAGCQDAKDTIPQPRAVFIGGSVQSGVSTLNRMLGDHPSILTCHLETSLVIAPNGVMDVVRAISTDYSTTRLELLLHEFDRLLHHHLCSPRSYPYSGFDLASFFGKERYHQAVELFIDEIGAVRHRGDGMTIGPGARIGHVHLPFKLKALRLPARLGRERTYMYHANRLSEQTALAAGRRLLDRLFGAKARAEGKLAWCEQSTNNQQFADFLLTLFPDGLYVNMTRDPLDVALAHYAQPWAIPDFARVCESLRDVYGRWFEVRQRLAAGSFIDVRFEDLVADPVAELEEVCSAAGLDGTFEIAAWRPDRLRLARERDRRAGADLRIYREVLGPTAEGLGYSVP